MSESTEPQHSEASPQHTPGPWHRCEAQPDAIVGPRCTEPCGICDDLEPKFGEDVPDSTYGDHFGGHFVCESVSSTANFNLITAAPDLLAACKDMREILLGITPMRVGAALATSAAAVAIAKAEGRAGA